MEKIDRPFKIENERCRIILDNGLKELPFTSEAKEIIQQSRNERNYNELELMLIELTGLKENVYKHKLYFRMIDGDCHAGKVIRLGNDWVLMSNIDDDEKSLLKVNNVISIS